MTHREDDRRQAVARDPDGLPALRRGRGRPGVRRRALLTLVVLTLLAAAVHAVAFSGASFTAGSANPATVFVAGSLSHVNPADGTFVVDAAGMRPGQSATGTFTITGGGTLTGTYTLTPASLSDTPASPGLSTALRLTVEDVTGPATTLYDGTVAAFTSASLGTVAPGVSRTYRLTLTFPAAAADPALQGAATELVLQVTGVSP